MNEGDLKQNPAAELIREIFANRQSGALRLAKEQAKAVIYFEEGSAVFAASNLRVHRLSEFLKRNKTVTEAQLAELPAKATDEELANLLVKGGRLRAADLDMIRANQLSEMLRAVLLWTVGEWQFDPRVRIGGDTRVTIDVRRLLLECARHLPADYVVSRFGTVDETLELISNGDSNLLPAEAFVLSRIGPNISLKNLLGVSGLREHEALRAVYGLSLSGFMKRSGWPSALLNGSSAALAKQSQEPPTPAQVADPDDLQDSLESLFARLEKSVDHYDVLDVVRTATPDDIKNAYHALARRYHPDRFHQSDAQLRSRVDSAFARIARAYEALIDPKSREAHDAQYAPQQPRGAGSSPQSPARRGETRAEDKESSRAENSFKQGLALMKENRPEQALRFFAEAASLDPRQARYRAEYGRALISQPQARRIAEIELKAAIELEPNNASYRVILAELYQALGLRRRAEGEIRRALFADPRNEAARQFMASLKK